MAFVALWDQGLNPCLLHQKADSFTVEPPGKPTLSLKKKIICLFLAALGLGCCAQAFSSCSARVSHRGGCSCCGVRALERGLGS